jgi:hypothetical protein
MIGYAAATSRSTLRYRPMSPKNVLGAHIVFAIFRHWESYLETGRTEHRGTLLQQSRNTRSSRKSLGWTFSSSRSAKLIILSRYIISRTLFLFSTICTPIFRFGAQAGSFLRSLDFTPLGVSEPLLGLGTDFSFSNIFLVNSSVRFSLMSWVWV